MILEQEIIKVYRFICRTMQKQLNVCTTMQKHINDHFHESSLKHQRHHHKYSKKHIEHLVITSVKLPAWHDVLHDIPHVVPCRKGCRAMTWHDIKHGTAYGTTYLMARRMARHLFCMARHTTWHDMTWHDTWHDINLAIDTCLTSPKHGTTPENVPKQVSCHVGQHVVPCYFLLCRAMLSCHVGQHVVPCYFLLCRAMYVVSCYFYYVILKIIYR